MKKSIVALAVMAAFSTAAVATPPTAKEIIGKGLYAAGGKRVGAVYRVDADGSALIIINGKLVRVPGDTITVEGGKVVTSLSKKDIVASR